MGQTWSLVEENIMSKLQGVPIIATPTPLLFRFAGNCMKPQLIITNILCTFVHRPFKIQEARSRKEVLYYEHVVQNKWLKTTTRTLEPLLKKHTVYEVYNHENQPIRSKLPPEIVILYMCLDEREVSKEEIFEPPRLALYHTPHHLIRTNQAVQKRELKLAIWLSCYASIHRHMH